MRIGATVSNGRQAAAENLNSRYMNVESGHLWNVWLRFDDTQDEEEFRAARCHSISTLSGQTHGLGLLIGIVAFFANLRHDYHPITRFCTFHDSIIVPFIIVYLSWQHNKFFTRWYSWIVILSEVAIAMSATYARSFLDPIESKSLMGVLNHFSTVSPLASMVVIGVAFRTSVRMQFLGQLVTVLLCKGWVSSSCKGGVREVEVVRVLDMLGWSFETFFGGLGTMFATTGRLAREDSEVFPCWMVAGYFHFAVGLVLPCTVKYILESHSRAKFLVCKFHKDSHDFVWRHFWDAFWFSFFVALTALVSGWMVFRGIAI
ncbi:hypothetical protein BSKO_06295 [Bryopsis sp. KO-2023]|nr:hypothetical protein BSKO_06295 [Bryopsis sp. KO-2023]